MDKYSFTKNIIDHLTLKKEQGNNYEAKTPNIEGFYKGNKPTLLVIFTGTNDGLEDTLNEIAQFNRYGFVIDIAISKAAEEIIELEGLKEQLKPRRVLTSINSKDLDRILKNTHCALVPMTTENTAIKLALGIQDTFILTLLWKLLWEGKTVFMDLDNVLRKKREKSKQPKLQQMIQGYCERLEEMGIKVVSKKNYSINVLQVLGENKEKAFFEDIKPEKASPKVITERDIKNISDSKKELIVSIKTIITPLAKDTAKKLGLKIKREG